jgi:hypothetical protein
VRFPDEGSGVKSKPSSLTNTQARTDLEPVNRTGDRFGSAKVERWLMSGSRGRRPQTTVGHRGRPLPQSRSPSASVP